MHTVRSETEDTLQEQSVPRSPHPWKLSLEQRKTLQPDELKLLIDERKDTFEDALALLLETSVDKKTFDEKIKKIKEEMKNIDIYINDIDKTILPDEAKKNLIADKESDRDVWVGNLEAANNELDALMLTDEQLEEAINYYEQRKQQCDGIGKGTDMQESIVRILCKLQDKIIASMDSINDLEQDRNKRKWDQDTKEVFKTEIADHMRVRDQYTKRMFAFASGVIKTDNIYEFQLNIRNLKSVDFFPWALAYLEKNPRRIQVQQHRQKTYFSDDIQAIVAEKKQQLEEKKAAESEAFQQEFMYIAGDILGKKIDENISIRDILGNVIEDANLDSCSAKHGYELFKTKADYFSPERIERYTMGDFSNMNHYVRKIFQYENELQSIGFAILPKTKKMKQLVKKDLDEANEWLTEFEKTILKKTGLSPNPTDTAAYYTTYEGKKNLKYIEAVYKMNKEIEQQFYLLASYRKNHYVYMHEEAKRNLGNMKEKAHNDDNLERDDYGDQALQADDLEQNLFEKSDFLMSKDFVIDEEILLTRNYGPSNDTLEQKQMFATKLNHYIDKFLNALVKKYSHEIGMKEGEISRVLDEQKRKYTNMFFE